jgi:hypothetical protein
MAQRLGVLASGGAVCLLRVELCLLGLQRGIQGAVLGPWCSRAVGTKMRSRRAQ